MRDAGRRPMGRLCYWVMGLVAVCIMQAASGAAATPQSGPATTTVTDTVYDATGNPANGTMIITWPAFTTPTSVSVDAGMTLPSGYGIEVRANDFGWGAANDRNLLGRFNTEAFNLPRVARTQNYFLRLYDSSSPPRYSRYSSALHVDYPL